MNGIGVGGYDSDEYPPILLISLSTFRYLVSGGFSTLKINLGS